MASVIGVLLVEAAYAACRSSRRSPTADTRVVCRRGMTMSAADQVVVLADA